MIERIVGGHRVFFLPVIKGLVSEADVVKDTILDLRPPKVLLSLPPEQWNMLGEKDAYTSYEPSPIERSYAYFLETFGPVEIPPPCYVMAYDLCMELGTPSFAIDMDESVFTELYCELVGTLEMFRESRFAKKALKKRFDLGSKEAFVLDWDAKVNSSPGFKELEKRREGHMAGRILEEAEDGLLAIIEYERMDGLLLSL